MISILPGSFDEMESDVHLPERLGIYQSVGDTAGPGGILRALRCDRSLVYEAFLNDPLVKGRASESEVRRLVDDMIANTAGCLPEAWKK